MQGGIRDGEAIRSWMHRRFVEVLQHDNRPFIVVSGSHEERMRAAVQAIESRVLARPDERAVDS